MNILYPLRILFSRLECGTSRQSAHAQSKHGKRSTPVPRDFVPVIAFGPKFQIAVARKEGREGGRDGWMERIFGP